MPPRPLVKYSVSKVGKCTLKGGQKNPRRHCLYSSFLHGLMLGARGC